MCQVNNMEKEEAKTRSNLENHPSQIVIISDNESDSEDLGTKF